MKAESGKFLSGKFLSGKWKVFKWKVESGKWKAESGKPTPRPRNPETPQPRDPATPQPSIKQINIMRNHEINVQCPVCGADYDTRLNGMWCPNCGHHLTDEEFTLQQIF